MEALLPSLNIWPQLQRTRDAVMLCLMQTLTVPNVRS
jgi:hypothetical protein